MYALHNCIIYSENKALTKHVVIIKGNKIHSIVAEEEIPSNIKKIDLHGINLCAGFIDLQINGCGGVSFNDNPTVQNLEIMQSCNLRSGTTTFLPTFITDDDAGMIQAIQAMEAYLSTFDKTDNIPPALGLHFEGPYISQSKRGVHRTEFVRTVSPKMLNHICDHSLAIKILTLAPENPTAKYIPELIQAGIVVSLGHSNATYDEAQRAINAGASCITHLYNAMSPISSGRDLGLVGAGLSQTVYAGIIADGLHVDFINLKMAYQLKPKHLCVVTDALAVAGTNIESFQFANKEIMVVNGKCIDQNGTLAGANITMLQSLQNLVTKVKIPLVDAVSLCTLNPARAINMDYCLGDIRSNYVANLTAFDHEFKIKGVALNGRWQSF